MAAPTAGSDLLVANYTTLADRITTLEALTPSAYSTYTPVWTSTGTAPAAGNAVTVGSYVQIGKLVHVWGKWTMGSTSTFGTGSYRWSLPVAVVGTFIANLGTVYARDFGTADYFGFVAAPVSSTTWTANIGTGLTAWTAIAATTPFTWAVNDFIEWNFVYQAA